MYWRGDVPLTVAPFNAVDNLVLSQLAYTSFDGVKRDRLGAMARARLRPGDVQGNDRQLLELLATSRRLGVARVRRAVEQLDEERQMQFGALTLELDDGTACVVFRGTDATLIGWKEDLNMSFADEIPSQAEAVRYLNDSARDTRRPLRVMGHSKGGNLAVYSSVKCRPEVRRRIIAVYNNDGPGLSERAMAEPGYARIERRIQTFLPQSSVVGILLGTAERYKVVHAEARWASSSTTHTPGRSGAAALSMNPGSGAQACCRPHDTRLVGRHDARTPQGVRRRGVRCAPCHKRPHAGRNRRRMAAQFHGDHIRAEPARSRKAPSCPRRNRRTYIRLRAQQIRSRR